MSVLFLAQKKQIRRERRGKKNLPVGATSRRVASAQRVLRGQERVGVKGREGGGGRERGPGERAGGGMLRVFRRLGAAQRRCDSDAGDAT